MYSVFKSLKFVVSAAIITELAIYSAVQYSLHCRYSGDDIFVEVPPVSITVSDRAEAELNESDFGEAFVQYERRLACYLLYLETFYYYDDNDSYVGIIPRTCDNDRNLASMYKILGKLRRKISAYGGLEGSRYSFSFKQWEVLFEDYADADNLAEAFEEVSWRVRSLRALQAVGLPYVLKEADYIRSTDLEKNDAYNRPAPDFVKILAARFEPDKPFVSCRNMAFLKHLLFGCYNKQRAVSIYSIIADSLKRCNVSLSDKDLLDVGSALSPYMPFFKRAVGVRKRPTATDVDYCAVCFSVLLNSDFNIRNYVCRSGNCMAEAESVDIVTLIDVHMGSDLKNDVEREKAFFWLCSMNRALRKDGVLVVCDDDQAFLEHGLESSVSRCGFKKLGFFRYDNVFIFVFKVDKQMKLPPVSSVSGAGLSAASASLRPE